MPHENFIKQQRALSAHLPVKEAALQAAWRLNVGNPHNTGRSTESAPPAAMAELLPDIELPLPQHP
jgi:hypothetical protein